MIERIFLRHPRDVGERYAEHWRVAMGFGITMTAGGIACMVHAFVPALFTRTGSTIVKKLYGDMKQRQPNLRDKPPAFQTSQWQPEYEI